MLLKIRLHKYIRTYKHFRIQIRILILKLITKFKGYRVKLKCNWIHKQWLINKTKMNTKTLINNCRISLVISNKLRKCKGNMATN